MKRLLAIFVTIIMVTTMFVPTFSVFAEDAATDYSDYVPGDMPTDIITNSWPYEGSTGSMNFGWSVAGVYGTEVQWAATTDIACTDTTYYGAMGTFIKQAKITETLEHGASYVFSAKIKNAGAEGTNPKFGIWFWGATKTFPVEYGALGYAPGSEFEDYNVTLIAPAEGTLQLGLGMVTASNGDILQLDWSEGIYFAKEQAYNITNEVVGSSKIFAGSSATLDAKVVNQVGSTGTLDQTMTFVALDADRATEVEGFDFTTNDDGTVNVAVADTVAAGTYVILAQSSKYAGFQKGAVIEVVGADAFTDYTVGEMPANLLARGSGGYVAGGTNGGGCTFGWYNGYGTGLSWKANQDLEFTATTANFSVAGAYIKSDYVNSGNALSANTTYVFKAVMRNAGAEGTSPKFQLYYNGNQGRCFSNEYGSEGWTPGMTDEDYKITFNTGASTSGNIFYGLVKASAGDVVYMATASAQTAYLAQEAAYEIEAVAEESKIVAGGSTTVTAKALNQIGLKGGLTQNFSYVALNSDRTAFADGITVTEGANGTATVNVASTVESGDYVIFVTSEDYPTLKKGVAISVINTADFQDNVSVEKVNLVVDPDDVNYFRDGNGCSGLGDYETGEYFEWIDSVDLASTNDIYYMAGASFLRVNKGHLTEDAVWTVGDTFVYSVRLKNDTPDIDEAPLFGLSFGNRNKLNALVSFPITNTDDYETYTGYYTSVQETSYVALGFARPDSQIPHTATNAVLNMDISNGGSLFIAKEAATEITNVFTGDSEVLPGESTTVKAEVLNQIGEKGNIGQGITWYALNPERTEVVDGITITDNGDGTASVEVDDSVSCGDYVILAMSDASDLRKGITLSVVNSKARVTTADVEFGEEIATLTSADVEGFTGVAVRFVIASYDTVNDKLIEAKKIDADTASLAEGIKISTAGADLVKIFAWDAQTLAPIKFADGIVTSWDLAQ